MTSGQSDSLKNNMLDVDDCFAGNVQPLRKIYPGNKNDCCQVKSQFLCFYWLCYRIEKVMILTWK